MKIGVISDTHGLLRPEVAPALAGVERILHLGDVGAMSILKELEKIAPVTAIRGKIAAVLSGHSHVPNFYRRKGVLYFNPGSCGPRRFQLPITVGLMTVSEDGAMEAEIVNLEPISGV